jgi:hypothetical protein
MSYESITKGNKKIFDLLFLLLTTQISRDFNVTFKNFTPMFYVFLISF